MTLRRLDPWREILGWHENDGTWLPPVDVLEKGDDLLIRAELPGVKIEDLDVRVENDVLHLQGERQRDPSLEEGWSYRQERTYGAFARSFSLPTTVDAAKIRANLRQGVLEIVLPKAEEAKPRKVEIQAA